MGGDANVLHCIAHLRRDVRRTNLASSFAEVLAVVVEREAGLHFDFDHRQREWTISVIDDADAQLAAGDESFDEIGHVEIRVEVLPTIDEKQSAARSTGLRLQNHAIVFRQHLANRFRSRKNARLRHKDAILQNLFRAILVECVGARDRSRAGKGDAAILHHFLHCAVLARIAMQRETKNGIVDRKRVERLLQIRPDRRTLRAEINFEGALMREKIVDRHIVNRAVGRPEPAERRAEGPDDVLSGGDGDVALVGRPAE